MPKTKMLRVKRNAIALAIAIMSCIGVIAVEEFVKAEDPSTATLLRAGFDHRVYEIVRSRRHWIPNPAVFADYGFSWYSVKLVMKEELDRFPRVKLVKLADDEKIYYITESGMKRHVPNERVFLSYGNWWGDVITVSPMELAAYPPSFLIRAAGAYKVYKLEDGKKRWIKNPEAFIRHGFDWSIIAPVNVTELTAYPEGPVIE